MYAEWNAGQTQKASPTFRTPFRCRLLKRSAAQTLQRILEASAMHPPYVLPWVRPPLVRPYCSLASALFLPWFGPKILGWLNGCYSVSWSVLMCSSSARAYSRSASISECNFFTKCSSLKISILSFATSTPDVAIRDGIAGLRRLRQSPPPAPAFQTADHFRCHLHSHFRRTWRCRKYAAQRCGLPAGAWACICG